MIRMLVLALLGALSVLQERPGRSQFDRHRPFTPLLNGKDLSGWKADEEARKHWVFKDGVLAFDGKGKTLWTEKEYGDFMIQVHWRLTRAPEPVERPIILLDGSVEKDDDGKVITRKVSDAGESGIHLRGSEKSLIKIWCRIVGSGVVEGYRADAALPVEARKSMLPIMRTDLAPGEWNIFTITLEGDRLTILLNSMDPILIAKLPGVPARGALGLQSCGDPIEFKAFGIQVPRGER